ncbi:MAG: hypothetical protein E7575_08465 [Ruminococcaceae bacterium]|nr:hypothetical protein [Oscillospiraceae bacterium]
MKKKEEVVEIDILKLARAVLRNIWAVILAAVIGASSLFGYTYFMVEPTYQSSALLYVNNNNGINVNADFNFTSSGLAAAQALVNTYVVILNARTTINEVVEYAGLEEKYSAGAVRGMIAAAPVNETEIFEVVVTCTDPKDAKRIAEAITKVLPERIADIVDGSSVRIVDYAVTPSARSGPSYTRNAMIGMIIGMVISVLVIAIREMYDVFIREEEYLSETYGIPVLAAIPNTAEGSGGSYKYSYSKYGGKYGYRYSYQSSSYDTTQKKGEKSKK